MTNNIVVVNVTDEEKKKRKNKSASTVKQVFRSNVLDTTLLLLFRASSWGYALNHN